MAMLAHLLQIFSWFIGPLVIFLMKKDSLFVRFHALQALLWQAVLAAFWGLGIMGFFATMFFSIPTQAQNSQQHGPPAGFFIGFFGMWILMAGAMLLNLVLSIVFTIKASSGEWADYPLLGRLARRLCSRMQSTSA